MLSAGRVIVPLHDGMQLPELEDCLGLADCGLLLYDERRGETAALLAQAIPGLALLELHEFVERLREEKRESLPEVLPLSETDVGLSLLPLSHTFEMMTHVAGALHCGGTLYLNESVRTVKKNLREKRPTILVAVPLILQTLHKEILNTAKKQGRLKQLQKAIRLSGSLQKLGLDVSGRLFGEVTVLLGGRLHTIICGGAALDPELIRGSPSALPLCP